MKWILINKSNTEQPTEGTYREWKPLLGEEGKHQCVYCSTTDGRFGGIRHFHVEHYKPKSVFPKLINNINNLFYACCICNVLKGADWRTITGNMNDIYYPDPSKVNYSTLFSLNNDGELIGTNKCGEYIINKLGLNRSQLIIDRRFTLLLIGYTELKLNYRSVRDDLISNGTQEAVQILRRLTKAYDKVIDKKDHLYEAVPYDMEDTKRPK